jgi:hypothetical protein
MTWRLCVVVRANDTVAPVGSGRDLRTPAETGLGTAHLLVVYYRFAQGWWL